MSPYSHTMMKEKINIQNWIMALCCAGTITACSEAEQPYPEGNGQPIAFTTPDRWEDVSVSRAETTEPFTGNDFGVYAYYHPASGPTQNFMLNQKVTNKGTTAAPSWDYEPKKYWPTATGDALSFYAYHPHSESYPTGKDAGNGVIVFDVDGTKDILWADKVNGKSTTGKSTTGESTNRHTYSEGATVKFSFRHLLNRVRFKFVQGDGYEADKSVSSVSITNVYTTYELDVKSGGFKSTGTAGSLPLTDYTLDTTPWLITEEGTPTDYFYIGEIDGTELGITLTVGDKPYTANISYTYKTDDETDDETDEKVKSYLITLTFIPEGVKVTLTVEKGTGTTGWEGEYEWTEEIQ